tara:strand:- start:328 stop:666 length:339 start_codon:yes stop_codon:yes gene_type:complete
MALSESAIKRNRKSNKRKKRLAPKVRALMNPIPMMGPIGGIPEVFMDAFKDPDYESGLGQSDEDDSALKNAAESGLMKLFKNSKGSSAKKKTKKKKPKGVGIASRGYGKAMK